MHKPLLVTDFLDRARRHYGDEEAVVATTGERFTYDEVGERADRFSAALRERGVEKGDRVAVLDPNTHYHLEAAYGSMQVGAVHTPLNYRLTREDFAYILEDAGVDAIYADHEYARKIEPIRDEIPTSTFVTNDAGAVDGEWADFDAVLAETEPDFERPEMAEDEVITINYTSGTTGDPKGVVRTHRCETLHAYLVSIHQEIREDDVYLWTLPMFHVNGWGHIYAATGMGAKHVCTRGVDAEGIFRAVAAEDVSYLCAAPTVLNRLVDHYEQHDPVTTGGNDVRVATAGSAPPEAIIRTVEDEFGWYLKHVYGATETGPLITTSDARRHMDEDSTSRFAVKKRQGLGYLGTDVRVVDEEGNDVPPDDETIGEVVVCGNQVMEGYWNKPGATEEAFSARLEGYYHTGDLAVVDENGMIARTGRKTSSSPAVRTSRRSNSRTHSSTTGRSRTSRSCRRRATSGARRPRRSSYPRPRRSTTRTRSRTNWSSSRARTSPATRLSGGSSSSTRSPRRRPARSRSTNSGPRSGKTKTGWWARDRLSPGPTVIGTDTVRHKYVNVLVDVRGHASRRPRNSHRSGGITCV